MIQCKAEKTITLNSVKYNKLSAQIGKQVVKFSKDLTVSKKSGVVIQPLTRPDASLLQQDKNEFLSSYPQSPIIRYSLQPTKKRKIENKADGSHEGTAQNGKETPSLASRASKKYKKEFPTQKSTISFKDVGGIDKILRELCELLLHIKHPDVYKHIGLPPPRGFLLHGPPGTGKTLLAQAIAGVSIRQMSRFCLLLFSFRNIFRRRHCADSTCPFHSFCAAGCRRTSRCISIIIHVFD